MKVASWRGSVSLSTINEVLYTCFRVMSCAFLSRASDVYAFFVGNLTPLVHLHCFKEKWKNWNWENHGHSVFLNLILNWVLHFLKKSGWTMWSSIPMLLRVINMNILCHLTYLAAISSPSLVVWSFLLC